MTVRPDIPFKALRDREWALERRLPIGSWTVPADIRVADGMLLYSAQHSDHVVKETPRVLEQFLALAEATPGKIAEYAKRWGVLAVCEIHMMPCLHRDTLPLAWFWSHTKSASPFRSLLPERWSAEEAIECLPIGAQRRSDDDDTSDLIWGERIDAWRFYARNTKLMLERANELRSAGARRDSESAWHEIDEWLHTWRWLAPMTVGMERSAAPPLIGFHPYNAMTALSAALALQATYAAYGNEGPLFCSNCKRPYIPKNLPRRGKRTFCSRSACKRAALTLASRDFSKRNPDYHKKYR